MMFQIEKLIIWPKSTAFAPREVEFKLGMVNVITGASRTGKSAIIPIIDYCLASSDCYIPIDTIRDHATWYGIIFQTAEEKILIARRVPIGSKVSNEFYVRRGAKISIPPVINGPYDKQTDVLLLLNTIASTPFFSMGDDEDNKFKSRLSFRDLMALVFQSQEIVANQNILFYKTHAHEHRERLRNWFPYILGAETLDVLKARHRLKDVETRLKSLKREFEKIGQVSAGWMENMRGLLNVADEYGLLQERVPANSTSEELLYIAKGIHESSPNQPKTEPEDINRATGHIAGLERIDEELSAAIGITKKRLNDVRRLRNNFVDYGNGIRKRTDRLHISKWLRDVAGAAGACPTCGSSKHPDSSIELEKICTAFEQHENTSKRTAEVPTSFEREDILLQKELSDLLEEKQAIQKRYDLILSKNQKAQKEFQNRKEMYLFLGHLEAALEIFENLSDGGDLKTRIEDLEKEQKLLQKISSWHQVKKALDLATAKISQNILEHLKTLDVEEKYRMVAPRFSVKDLSVQVLSDDGHWHFLAEVGSASNWVSFHLALMCGLQEYFLDHEPSSVPSFVVFDQPSQVYFPKVKHNAIQDDDPEYETDEDVDAVTSMFKTLVASIQEKEGRWQAIVLDHADKSVYGDIKGIHEVDEWRNGKKLIPEIWYTPSETEE